jgi:hypothetical protein
VLGKRRSLRGSPNAPIGGIDNRVGVSSPRPSYGIW